MKRWLILAQYEQDGERLPRVAGWDHLEVVTVFESGDGAQPLEGDLRAALAERFDECEEQEVLLVPLDDAKTIGFSIKLSSELIWTGSAP